MNYCNVLEDLLKEVSKRDFERPVLERLFPVFLKPALPLDLPLVYDKRFSLLLRLFCWVKGICICKSLGLSIRC